MEENSTPSAQTGKKRTRKTRKSALLTQEQVLEILTQCLLECQHSGIHIKLQNTWRSVPGVLILLEGAKFAAGKIVPAGDGPVSPEMLVTPASTAPITDKPQKD